MENKTLNDPKVAPYGSWRSPITSDLIVAGTIRLGEILLDGGNIYWVESRPLEGGRNVIVRHRPDGHREDAIPEPYNARNTVHEYGGGSYLPAGETLFFTNFSDQRLYRLDHGHEPQPITPEADMRYADFVIDQVRRRLISVRQDHTITGSEAQNTLVSLSLESNNTSPLGGEVLTSGRDFYSNPRLSPDGSRLAWLSWNHPNMPWDGTELWVGALDATGKISAAERVAGGEHESIFQPEWSPQGVLYFVSERTGWWNLYRWTGDQVEPVFPLEAEFGLPQWVFRLSTYGFESERDIICSVNFKGKESLSRLDTVNKTLSPLPSPYTNLTSVRVGQGFACFIGGSPKEYASIARYDLARQEASVLRRSNELQVEPGYISSPQAIEFLTQNDLTAYGFFYPPQNQDFIGPKDEKPPLLVMAHGGPTSAVSAVLDLRKQFWTSRGFAVLDVNYGGSTGFGRAYRERLNGEWGVVDVVDSINGAQYLVERGEVDKERLAITGGSAGGYTTLCALTFYDYFQAGSSHFGIADLEVFEVETHKFESRYDQRLIGPYPERRDIYRARSPIHHMERLSAPMILFHGLEDKVVPANQSEMIFKAARRKGLPVAYLAFEGEQHGFRRADSIKRALDAELYFFGRIFGFKPSDPIQPISIENLD